MTEFNPQQHLDQLADEYQRRATAIRRDLSGAHSADFAEQVTERENDDVLRALLAEAEDGLQQVERARQRLSAGLYGQCVQCGASIGVARLSVLPTAERCMDCLRASEG
ncbi:TraR/DksA family transcriptional regulator [Pseudomonas sp. NW5]|uniref:TraR/DksA family transcriptional regulator n=1 Tax=Pseudomonas sp. NW5 TaxID=2934934 RepID=UPI0020225654|nr:TraR/DksA family transcriptional regulator [Pseudomonas sp. NW5]MCL7461930.1 TraR/DksA family transcriptional regulator [Pseudomonas sp. NW5]